jgi:ferric-dicitrate binding protein FerR (iron transport regulator)
MSDPQRLIAAYLTGERSARDQAQLERWLLEEPNRVSDFAQLLLLEEELRRDDLFGDIGSSQKRKPAASMHARNSASRRLSPRKLAWAVAASLLACVTGYAVFEAMRSEPPPVDADMVADAEDGLESGSLELGRRVVAYLGRTSNCVWESEQFAEGTQLHVGSQLRLSAGMADVIFENGARVKVRGPCALFMDDAQACSLRYGSASVNVPDSAFGFKVVTPSGIIVDLGTEFGVDVDRQGDSEVHVFQGQVVFQPLTERGDHYKKSISLKADQACGYGVGGTTLREFVANEAKFAWRNRPPLRDDEVPLLPVQDGVALWLAADRYVDVDDDGGVYRWSDLHISANNSAEDALQLNPDHRPHLVKDAINGRPALRFAHGAFLLTPPLATTNEQTAFVVLQLGNIQPHVQSILNYNGPPQRTVGPFGGLMTPSVFEICLRDRDLDGHFAVCGELFSGVAEGGGRNVVKTVVEALDTLEVRRPLVIAFRYSLGEQQMSLYVNGYQRASQAASTRVAITSRKILGRHPTLKADKGKFAGDMAEVLIYNRALTPDEVSQVSSYLAARYAISK